MDEKNDQPQAQQQGKTTGYEPRKARKVMLDSLRNTQDYYVSRLVKIQAIKSAIDMASDEELELILKHQEMWSLLDAH